MKENIIFLKKFVFSGIGLLFYNVYIIKGVKLMKAFKSIIAFLIILTLTVAAPAVCAETKAATAKGNNFKTIEKTAYLYTKTELPYFGDDGDGYRYSCTVSKGKCISVHSETYIEGCVHPEIVGKKLTKGNSKPVITIYRNMEGEPKQVYRKYRITVKKTPKVSQKLNVNKNALKLTKLKSNYTKKFVFKYSDKNVARIKPDSVLSGNIYDSGRWQKGKSGYCVKGLKYGKTRVKVYLKGTKIKVADFKITVKNVKPAIKKKYKTVKLWHSKYGFVKKGNFCVEDIVNDLSVDSKLSVKIADKKIAFYYVTSPENEDYDVTMISAKKLGKTNVDVYETLNGVKRKVGTVKIVVKKATMADAAWNAPYEEEFMDLPEELYPGDTCDIKEAVESYYLEGFKAKDYKITIKSKFPKIASVSKGGVLKVLKPGFSDDEQLKLVEFKIVFRDKSVLKDYMYFYVINNIKDSSKNYKYELNRDDTVSVKKYIGKQTKLTIPEKIDGHTVTGIGERAFPNKTTEVTIPSCVTNINIEAFDYTKISKITVDEGNPKYSSSEDGVLYNKSKTKLLRFPPMKKLESYDVTQGVEKIGSRAFYECQVKSVKLPSSVKTIESYAFASFSSKKGTNEVYASYDSEETYKYTHSLLENITLPEGVKEIGEKAFNNSSVESVKLPESLSKIGREAFSESALKSVAVPSGIKALYRTFDGCKKLTKVTLSEGLEKIGNFAFCDCPIKKLKLPSSVTEIGNESLKGTREVILSDNLKTIKPTPFDKRLKKISISSKNKYFSTSKNLIYNKNKTELVYYPVGRNAKSFTIPKTVKIIRPYSFVGVKINSITIPGSVREIKSTGFYDCKINKLIIKNGVKKLAAHAFCEGAIGGKVVVPDSVKKYGRNAFCGDIKSFTVPKCFKKVKYHEFNMINNIKEIIIPSYVKSVHKFAFDSSDYLSPKPIVKGKKGTAAEKFAKANKLKFIPIDI